ncbi:MAG: leucine--tRNA ligase [Cytophagales bacterium]|nr:leucine--tRNA ligase [Armatimonadota bacterium]
MSSETISDNLSSAPNIIEEATRRYPFQAIERRWQQQWAEAGVYRTTENKDRPKYYVLDMFPYPSGSGLHVGHCKNYVPGDVVARFQHMRGHNVLHPMGWDAFGQPAEQDAIKRNINPRLVVPLLAKEYKRQMNLLGIGYDWDREINSTSPEYYRWNQWAFLRLHEKGLAYRKTAPVNWCVNESTVLANEEVNDGTCWRCDGPVVKKDLPQWFFKITAYAEKLLAGLDRIDWPEGVKTQQRDWIGRSEGVEFDIPVLASPGAGTIRVFTTRVDTVYGMSFVVLSPEHPLVESITTEAQRGEVAVYREKAARLSDMDRTAEGRERTGVFTGAYGTNPVSGHRVPIYLADYVLTGYGTGAIMAVPAHDARDFEFARRYHLPIPVVIVATEAEVAQPPLDGSGMTEAFTAKDGLTVNSDRFSGLPVKVAGWRIAEWMESEGIGVRRTNYKLRDWLVSRQRYWGTPIPIIHCPQCGEVPVPLADLPVVLPDVENYKPTGDGRSPLAAIADFVNVSCPRCGGAAQRETDTMAGSVDSSWYFLRFTSPGSEKEPWDRRAADYWMPVNRYIGGREHAVGHLLYARFFTHFFYDEALISTDEPFASLSNQGMLLAETTIDADSAEKHPVKRSELVGFDFDSWLARWKSGGAFAAERVIKDTETGGERVEPVSIDFAWLKMSKSKENAVTPDYIAEKYGSDSLRLYILFEAPFEDTIQWSEERMTGVFRFANRVWDVVTGVADTYDPSWPDKVGAAADTDSAQKVLRRRTHQAIIKVTDDIAEFRFNTAVSALMIHSDALRKHILAHGAASPAVFEAAATLIKLLSPLAPHIADELWERLGHSGNYLYNAPWPAADSSVAAPDEITLIVQINGKLVDRLTLPADADAKTCELSALDSPKIKAATQGKTIRKIIFVPGKLVNVVVG